MQGGPGSRQMNFFIRETGKESPRHDNGTILTDDERGRANRGANEEKAQKCADKAAKKALKKEAQKPMEPGQRVVLTGLVDHPDFNGKEGIIQRFDSTLQVYEVRVHGGQKPVLVKVACNHVSRLDSAKESQGEPPLSLALALQDEDQLLSPPSNRSAITRSNSLLAKILLPYCRQVANHPKKLMTFYATAVLVPLAIFIVLRGFALESDFSFDATLGLPSFKDSDDYFAWQISVYRPVNDVPQEDKERLGYGPFSTLWRPHPVDSRNCSASTSLSSASSTKMSSTTMSSRITSSTSATSSITSMTELALLTQDEPGKKDKERLGYGPFSTLWRPHPVDSRNCSASTSLSSASSTKMSSTTMSSRITSSTSATSSITSMTELALLTQDEPGKKDKERVGYGPFSTLWRPHPVDSRNCSEYADLDYELVLENLSSCSLLGDQPSDCQVGTCLLVLATAFCVGVLFFVLNLKESDQRVVRIEEEPGDILEVANGHPEKEGEDVAQMSDGWGDFALDDEAEPEVVHKVPSVPGPAATAEDHFVRYPELEQQKGLEEEASHPSASSSSMPSEIDAPPTLFTREEQEEVVDAVYEAYHWQNDMALPDLPLLRRLDLPGIARLVHVPSSKPNR
ncbi:der [Symbiodinium sp. CCMP2592]|nr:der [Symbiodinium sp. CCMP2592]